MYRGLFTRDFSFFLLDRPLDTSTLFNVKFTTELFESVQFSGI